MNKSAIDRRRFLLGTALAGGGATLLGSAFTRAEALSLQPMTEGVRADYLAARSCGNDQSYHDDIGRIVRAELDKLPAQPPGQNLSRTVTCPLCGCPILVTRDAQ